jgi:hypothetical protein
MAGAALAPGRVDVSSHRWRFRGRGVIADSGGGPGAAPRSGRSRIAGARKRERRGQNLPVGLQQTRRHLTVARRRRSVKEPSGALTPRGSQPSLGFDDSMRSGLNSCARRPSDAPYLGARRPGRRRSLRPGAAVLSCRSGENTATQVVGTLAGSNRPLHPLQARIGHWCPDVRERAASRLSPYPGRPTPAASRPRTALPFTLGAVTRAESRAPSSPQFARRPLVSVPPAHKNAT